MRTLAILLTITLAATAACGDNLPPDPQVDAGPPAEIDAPAGDVCVCVTAADQVDVACALRALDLPGGLCVQIRCPQAGGEVWLASVCAP